MMSETDSESVNVEQYANETVRLTTAITAVMNSPDIVTGEVSGSGKTIAVEHPNREGKTFRLDTATIMAGDSEFRDSRSFTLYTREDFQNTQSANYGPGPQAGANGVSDAEDLPEPTHTPVGEDGEDADEDSDDDPDADGDASEDAEDGRDEFGRVREGERVRLTGVTEDGERMDARGTVKIVSGAGTTVELDDGRMVRKKASVIKARSPEGVPLYFRKPEMEHITEGEEPDSEGANPGSDGGQTVMTDGGEDSEDPDSEDGDSTPVYRDRDGGFTDDRMENAWFWAAQADGWMTEGPNAGLEGHYYVTVLAGQAVIVLDGEKFGHESNVTAIIDALHDYDFPASITSRELETANETRIFIEPDDSRLSSYYVDEWREWERDNEFSDTEPDHELMTDGGEWDPEPATLREDDREDMDAHARRNAEQIEMARRDGIIGGEEPDSGGTNPGGETDKPGRTGPVDPHELSEGDRVTVECSRLPITNSEDYPTEVTGEVTAVEHMDTREFHETGEVIISGSGGAYTLTYEPGIMALATGEGAVFGDVKELTRAPAVRTDGGEGQATIPHLSSGDEVRLDVLTLPTSGGEPDRTLTGTVQNVTHDRAPPQQGGNQGEVVIQADGDVATVTYNPFDARVAWGTPDDPETDAFAVVVESERVETDGGECLSKAPANADGEPFPYATDGGEESTGGDGGPIGKDAPVFGSENLSVFESSVRRKMSKNWSLASSVWELKDESSDARHLITFYHRDSISRIQLSTSGTWVDADVRVEVYAPISKEEARKEPDDSVNDITVTDKTLDKLGEAVWLAEYFARNVDERIPDDPATDLYGPADGDDPDANPGGDSDE